jgi:multicomponent Na+:H+ antiporter subunit B
MLSINILIIFMIVSALIAIEARDYFVSVIAVGVLGLELSLAFLLLKAPDLAIIFLVLEMIALAVFVKAITLGHKPKSTVDFDVFSTLTFIAFGALFVIICLKAFAELPQFGSPLMRLGDYYGSRSLEQTGAANIVAAIAFNFRGLDSLITVMILFLTAMGISHIAGKKE